MKRPEVAQEDVRQGKTIYAIVEENPIAARMSSLEGPCCFEWKYGTYSNLFDARQALKYARWLSKDHHKKTKLELYEIRKVGQPDTFDWRRYLDAAQKKAAKGQQPKTEASLPHTHQVPHNHQEDAQKPHDAQPGGVTYFQHGCKDFKIENERTLSFTNQHGDKVYVVSEEKGIERPLVKAVTSYTGKGGEQ